MTLAALPRVTLFGVPDRLQQAVLNLVLNAIQAMPHGGRVALQTSEADGLVRRHPTGDSGSVLSPDKTGCAEQQREAKRGDNDGAHLNAPGPARPGLASAERRYPSRHPAP